MKTEVELTIESTKLSLKPYGNIILRLYPIFIWQKPYYAICLSLIVTAIFLSIWIVDASLLSLLCFVGIVLTTLDYFLPMINGMLNVEKWSDKDEVEYSNFCENISKSYVSVLEFYRLFTSWKHTNTKIYYSTLLTTLLVFAWIGTVIHNLLLLYMVTLFAVLYPGLTHHNLISKGFSSLSKSSPLNKFKKNN